MFGTALVWGSLAVHNVAARSMPASNMTTASAGLRNALKRDLWCVKLGCIRTISQRLRDQNRSINAKQLDLGIADTLVLVHAGRLDSAYRQQCRQVTGLVDRELACWAARPLRCTLERQVPRTLQILNFNYQDQSGLKPIACVISSCASMLCNRDCRSMVLASSSRAAAVPSCDRSAAPFCCCSASTRRASVR